jgi:putative tricarboxylic transport membrane protein
MLADEHIAFVVNANSALRSGRDLIEHLKKDPASVNMALASALGNANHIAVCLVGKSIGVDSKRFKIAVFNSSGESIAAVLGGHVDLAITTVGLVGRTCRRDGCAGLIGERLGGFRAVPTWREQGVDVVFSSWRALIGPRASRRADCLLGSARGKSDRTGEWTHELELNSLTPAYMGSEATRNCFAARLESCVPFYPSSASRSNVHDRGLAYVPLPSRPARNRWPSRIYNRAHVRRASRKEKATMSLRRIGIG